DIHLFGPQGGPFSFVSTNYAISNAGLASFSWSASAPAPFAVLPSSGTLAPGAKQTATVSLNAAQAVNIAGVQEFYVRFSNQVSHVATQRRFTINAYEPLQLTSGAFLKSEEWLRGAQGGPFTNLWGPLSLTNLSAQTISWTSVVPDVVTLTPSSGTLGPGQ